MSYRYTIRIWPITLIAKKHILVIDDEDGIRRALRTVLERVGYRVREARSGRDALRLWHYAAISLNDAGLSRPIRTLDKPFKLTEMLDCVRDALQSAERGEGRA